MERIAGRTLFFLHAGRAPAFLTLGPLGPPGHGPDGHPQEKNGRIDYGMVLFQPSDAGPHGVMGRIDRASGYAFGVDGDLIIGFNYEHDSTRIRVRHFNGSQFAWAWQSVEREVVLVWDMHDEVTLANNAKQKDEALDKIYQMFSAAGDALLYVFHRTPNDTDDCVAVTYRPLNQCRVGNGGSRLESRLPEALPLAGTMSSQMGLTLPGRCSGDGNCYQFFRIGAKADIWHTQMVNSLCTQGNIFVPPVVQQTVAGECSATLIRVA